MKAKKVKIIDGVLYIGTFIKHPINGFYEVKSIRKCLFWLRQYFTSSSILKCISNVYTGLS